MNVLEKSYLPPLYFSSEGEEHIWSTKSQLRWNPKAVEPLRNQIVSSIKSGANRNGYKQPGYAEQISNWNAFCTYFCYAIFILVGYFRNILSPPLTREKNREGYVPLYSGVRRIFHVWFYKRAADCVDTPITSAPGSCVEVLERELDGIGKLRYTGKKRTCINLGSYNYLGFAENDGECAKASIEAVQKYGVGTCSTRAELGDSSIIRSMEKLIARFLGVEDVITCAMGFATNSMNIPAILGKGCLVLSDEKNHASIVIGLRLSGATVRIFKHNDVMDLEQKLKDAIINGQETTRDPWNKIFIVVEGIYSMDGTIVRLPEMIKLKRHYKAYLFLDEAHSVGAMGPNGRGIVDYWGCNPKDVDILMGTFTKSFGSCGGYIAGSRQLIQHLRQTSYAHTYGTAMSPAIAQQIISSMKIIMGEDGTNEGTKRIGALQKNTHYFRGKLNEAGFIVYGDYDSPVIPVLLYMPTKIVYIFRELMKRGVATTVVGYPATKLVEGRTRFCVSAAHSKEMIDHVVQALVEIGREINII